MADPMSSLVPVLQDAFAQVTGLAAASIDPVVRPSERADAQVNGALALAKQVGRPPRELAQAVVATGALELLCSDAEVAGPGFINLTLRPRFVAGLVGAAALDARAGVTLDPSPERIVVDYSAPNVAKEMHAGHLRTTVIGDAIVRILQFLGHTVIRENHLGDWGTPFGMLIEHLVDLGGLDRAGEMDVSDLNAFYQAARVKFDASDEFKERARERVVLLQGRDDPATLALWQILVNVSLKHFNDLYAKLGVLLTDADIAGESKYQDLMLTVLPRLDAAGLLHESAGAQVVSVPGYTNREGDPLPLIVQARTGGFNYATSDLACVIDRVENVHATRLVYVVGTPQSQHLAMVFKVAEMAGIIAPPTRAIHVNFGSVLGEDRKMLRSRSGDPVTFSELVDEAIARGRAAVAERSPELTDEDQHVLGQSIGIGALKYAELSVDRVKDYVFDWDRLLSFEGNTGPYLQYAHARICSIFRRGGIERATVRGVEPVLDTEQEKALALKAMQFDTAVHAASDSYSPHKLATYLFELAQQFTTFYDACPVLRADEPTRRSRLALCDVSARVLETGLGLLGIDAPERM